ncbi:hypothetical protein HDU99_008999 [Rhizoclosmatium hyalinum]|nr:hypothetical protein HDU99_008999 [Rhizoclosmatium hyalinum]
MAESKIHNLPVLLVNALLEGTPGILGLLGTLSGLFSGPEVLFGITKASKLETAAFTEVYSLLSFLGGLAFAFLYFSKSANRNTSSLMPYLFGGVVYHLMIASFSLHRLLDFNNSPLLPGPNYRTTATQLQGLPVLKTVGDYLTALTNEELRVVGGGLAVLTHVTMGVWFVISIVSASENWLEPAVSEGAAPVVDKKIAAAAEKVGGGKTGGKKNN